MGASKRKSGGGTVAAGGSLDAVKRERFPGYWTYPATNQPADERLLPLYRVVYKTEEERELFARAKPQGVRVDYVREPVSVWQSMLGLIPPLNQGKILLRISTLIVLALAFAGPVATRGIDAQLSSSPHNWLPSATRQFADPVYAHVFVGMIIVGALICAARFNGASWWHAVIAAGIALGIGMAFEYSFDTFLMKPAIGLPRPSDFVPASEPFFERMVHRTIGLGDDYPSGTVARQTILACFLTWSLMHPGITTRRYSKILLAGFGWALVIAIALLRIGDSAHSVGGVLVGASSGIFEFWIVAVGFGALVNPQARGLTPYLAQMWVVLMSGWIVLSQNKMLLGFLLASAGLLLPNMRPPVRSMPSGVKRDAA